jgi:hypothetical protein
MVSIAQPYVQACFTSKIASWPATQYMSPSALLGQCHIARPPDRQPIEHWSNSMLYLIGGSVVHISPVGQFVVDINHCLPKQSFILTVQDTVTVLA